jgi:DNA adenine methylase
VSSAVRGRPVRNASRLGSPAAEPPVGVQAFQAAVRARSWRGPGKLASAGRSAPAPVQRLGADDGAAPWSKPFLRWAGSKRSLLGELLEHYRRAGGRYVEPFAGSACLFFAARPSEAVISDLNVELIDTYRELRAHPRLLSRALGEWETDTDTYYAVRALAPDDLSPLNRAARFIYLNRLCFNGLYRTNRAGQFNVPYGQRTGMLPSEGQLYRCSVALRSASLRCGDFAEALSDVRAGDFIYLDPPYARTPHNAYGVYGYGSFSEHDMRRMLETLRMIDDRGATFLFSYADIPAAVEGTPERWRLTRLSAPGRIAASISARTPRAEILITNAAEPVA